MKSRAAHATDDAQRRADLRRDSLDARALRLLEADDDARRRLAEQLRRRRQFAREFYGRADALAPDLQSYADEHKVFLHGFGRDIGNGHWNEEGHRVAGELIAQKLCEQIAE